MRCSRIAADCVSLSTKWRSELVTRPKSRPRVTKMVPRLSGLPTGLIDDWTIASAWVKSV